MNFALFIAKRLYREKGDRKRVSRPAITIATLGVAIGLAVMIISVSVALGFKDEIKSKVIGFGSHIQVTNLDATNSMEVLPVQVNDSVMKVLKGLKGIAHVQRFVTKPGLIKTDENFQGMILKGVAQEYDPTFFKQHLIAGEFPRFSDSSSSNKLLISKATADKLKLHLGDKVFTYYFENAIRIRRFQIVGIYRTNLSAYDNNVMMTDLYTVRKLNNWMPDQCSGVEMTVNDFNKLDSIDMEVVQKVNRHIDAYGDTYSAKTIKEVNPDIFAWLSLMDMNVWVILILMMGVAGFTMISGLLIIILERTQMIGLLKALGASNRQVRHVFLYFSAFLIGRGLLLGDVIGIGLLFLQRLFGLVHLDPATYYVETVPVMFNWGLFLLLNVATLLISLFILIAPSYLVSHIEPSKAMRFE